MKVVYIVGTDYSVINTFVHRGWIVVEEMELAEYVCFTGGADINPSLYGQTPHKTTRFLPNRDAFEVAEYRKARQLGKKILGICRGAQLMNALEGGSMFQHVNHHHGHHCIKDLHTGKTFFVNSIHHQMMIPCANSTIIATARGQSDQRELMIDDEDSIDGAKVRVDLGIHDDPEALIFYDQEVDPQYGRVSFKNFGLGLQGHPEYGHAETTDYFFELIERYL